MNRSQLLKACSQGTLPYEGCRKALVEGRIYKLYRTADKEERRFLHKSHLDHMPMFEGACEEDVFYNESRRKYFIKKDGKMAVVGKGAIIESANDEKIRKNLAREAKEALEKISNTKGSTEEIGREEVEGLFGKNKRGEEMEIDSGSKDMVKVCVKAVEILREEVGKGKKETNGEVDSSDRIVYDNRIDAEESQDCTGNLQLAPSQNTNVGTEKGSGSERMEARKVGWKKAVSQVITDLKEEYEEGKSGWLDPAEALWKKWSEEAYEAGKEVEKRMRMAEEDAMYDDEEVDEFIKKAIEEARKKAEEDKMNVMDWTEEDVKEMSQNVVAECKGEEGMSVTMEEAMVMVAEKVEQEERERKRKRSIRDTGEEEVMGSGPRIRIALPKRAIKQTIVQSMVLGLKASKHANIGIEKEVRGGSKEARVDRRMQLLDEQEKGNKGTEESRILERMVEWMKEKDMIIEELVGRVNRLQASLTKGKDKDIGTPKVQAPIYKAGQPNSGPPVFAKKTYAGAVGSGGYGRKEEVRAGKQQGFELATWERKKNEESRKREAQKQEEKQVRKREREAKEMVVVLDSGDRLTEIEMEAKGNAAEVAKALGIEAKGIVRVRKVENRAVFEFETAEKKYQALEGTKVKEPKEGCKVPDQSERRAGIVVAGVPTTWNEGDGQNLKKLRKVIETENNIVLMKDPRWLSRNLPAGCKYFSAVIHLARESERQKVMTAPFTIEGQRKYGRVFTSRSDTVGLQCTRCCGFGHGWNNCRQSTSPRCAWCGVKGHTTRTHTCIDRKCKNAGLRAVCRTHPVLKCMFCGGDHSAYDNSCAKRREAMILANQDAKRIPNNNTIRK